MDEVIIMSMVLQNPLALQGAEAYQDDERIVMAAVMMNPHSLQWASDRLRNDPLVVLTAVGRDPQCFYYIGDRLIEDREFLETLWFLIWGERVSVETDTFRLKERLLYLAIQE